MMTLTGAPARVLSRFLSAHVVYNILQRNRFMYFVNLQLLFVKGYVLKHFHGMGGEYILWQCMRKIGAK